MSDVVSNYRGYFSERSLPGGVTATKIEKFELSSTFKAYLQNATYEKESQWNEHVYENAEEFGNPSIEELYAIANNPYKELKTESLLEILEVYALFKDGKAIGYYLEVADYVQAAIYQDGAWINIFLDTDQNVVGAFDESA